MTILNYKDPNFTVDIKKPTPNGKKTMIITDKHKIWDAEGADDNERNLHRNLMVMLNLVDIIHDVIASGDLSYSQKASFKNLITGYSILYNFDENKAKQIICQALYFNDDTDFLEILKDVTRNQDLKAGNDKDRRAKIIWSTYGNRHSSYGSSEGNYSMGFIFRK